MNLPTFLHPGKWFVSMLILLLSAGAIHAQNPIPNSYTMAEGIDFTGKKDYSINLRGYIQPYFEAKKYTEEGNDELLNRFRMRRLRLRLSGDAAQQKIEYRLQVDLSGSSEVEDADNVYYLLDAFITYNLTRRIGITFGQRATPTDSRELTMGSQTLQLVERSRVTSAFNSIREFGIFADGTFRLPNGMYLRPYLTLTNGDGRNVFGKDHGGFKYGGRLDFLPFGLFYTYGQFRQADLVRELSPKFVIGAYYSYNQGMSSRRGRASGAIIYLNGENEESLPNYMKWGIDFMFKYRGFSMIGEFVNANATVPEDITYRVRNDGSVASTFLVDGVQDVENYVKGRMMLGQGYNIQMGYVMKNGISIDARYAHLVPAEHSFLYNGTFYNRPDYYTLGLSKYFERGYGFKIQGSVTYVKLDPGSNDIYGNPITGNEWIYRLITSLAF